MKSYSTLISMAALVCCLAGCDRSSDTPSDVNFREASDEVLMDTVQSQTFRYFWDFAEPNSGMAPERYHVNGIYPLNDAHIVTAGGSGFGVMALIVGIERGYITREEGIERLVQIVDFLETADRFKGVWAHWMNGETGRVKPFSKMDDGGDLVESAFLVQGLLCVRQYCNRENPIEKDLAERIDVLWREMDWNWYTNGTDNLYWHWSPNYGFDKTGSKVLWWQAYGTVILLSNGEPIATPDDMKGKKARVFGKTLGTWVQTVGGVPTLISGSEQFLAYQRGTVDIGMTGVSGVQSRSLWDVMDTITKVNVADIEFIVVVNENFWEGLTEQQQMWINEAATRAEADVRDRVSDIEATAYQEAEANGMTVYELTPEEVDKWRTASRPVIDQWLEEAGDLGQKVYNAAKKL